MTVQELLLDLLRPDGGHYNWESPKQGVGKCKVRILSASDKIWDIVSVYYDAEDNVVCIDIEDSHTAPIRGSRS